MREKQHFQAFALNGNIPLNINAETLRQRIYAKNSSLTFDILQLSIKVNKTQNSAQNQEDY